VATFAEIMARGVERTVSSGNARWPEIKRLEIGESFSVAVENEQALRMAAWRYGKKLGRRFTVRRGDGLIWCGRLA